MLKRAVTGKNERALKIAGAAIAVFLLLQYAVLPLWDRVQDAGAEVSLQEQTLGKYRRAVAAAGPRAKEAQELVDRLRQAETRLLEAGTEPLAAAELEKLVKSMASTNGIDLKSSEFNKPVDGKNGYKQIPVGIAFQCRLDQLVNFLSSLQASERLLSVSKLAVQPAGGLKKEVVVSMTIGGWIRSAG